MLVRLEVEAIGISDLLRIEPGSAIPVFLDLVLRAGRNQRAPTAPDSSPPSGSHADPGGTISSDYFRRFFDVNPFERLEFPRVGDHVSLEMSLPVLRGPTDLPGILVSSKKYPASKPSERTGSLSNFEVFSDGLDRAELNRRTAVSVQAKDIFICEAYSD